MADSATPKSKAKTRTKSKAKTRTKSKTPPKKSPVKAEPPENAPVAGEISSFDDSSGTGYVAVGDKWFPLDLSRVDFGDDHFVNWKSGRKVKATIDNDRVKSICVDDEYSSD